MLPTTASPSSLRGSGVAPVTMQARPEFVLFHDPNAEGSWAVSSEGFDAPTWVPSCNDLLVQPGAGGVCQPKAGRDQLAFVSQIAADSGRVLLPQRLGYMQALPCIDPMTMQPGTVHIRAWSQVLPPLRIGEAGKEKVDHARQNRAFVGYFTDGAIPAPDPRLINRIIDRAVSAADEARSSDRVKPEYRKEVTRERANAARVLARAHRPWDPGYTPDPEIMARLDVIDPPDAAPAPAAKAKAEKVAA